MANPLYGQNKIDTKIDDQITGKKQVYRFATPPVVNDYEHTANALADGTAQDTVLHVYADGLNITWSAVVAQAINNPAPTSTGINYAGDQTNNDGIELVYSCVTAKGREGVDRFTVGKQAFSAELEFSIATVAGTDDCLWGFRKVEAPVAIDSYTDVASIGIITAANPAVQQICTALNNAAMSETSTTDTLADGVVTTWEVYVSSAGVCTFKIDGAAPTTTASFTFDSGDYVTPFMHMLGGGAHGAVTLISLDHGRQ